MDDNSKYVNGENENYENSLRCLTLVFILYRSIERDLNFALCVDNIV